MKYNLSILSNSYLLYSLSSYTFLFVFCSYLFVSCSNEEPAAILPPQPKTERVIIAYLATDNSLSFEVDQKITALIEGFLATENNDQNKLFIYHDRKNASPQLIQINAQAEEQKQIIKNYPSQNSASGKVFAQVMKDVIENYPAASYGLILFSHGTAWLPAKGLKDPYVLSVSARTVATDNDDEMELKDFASSLPLANSKKWSFILFEGCYMGSIEVAYELKDKTEAIIASPTEIVSPGMKEVYPLALSQLYLPSPGLEDFAHSYFEVWNSKYGDYRSATISVIRTEYLDELATLARAALIRWKPDEETINGLQCFNRNEWHLFFDLKETLLTANPALETYINNLWKSMVIYAAATPTFLKNLPYGFNIRTYSGLSCYIPRSDFLGANQAYEQTEWWRMVYK